MPRVTYAFAEGHFSIKVRISTSVLVGGMWQVPAPDGEHGPFKSHLSAIRRWCHLSPRTPVDDRPGGLAAVAPQVRDHDRLRGLVKAGCEKLYLTQGDDWSLEEMLDQGTLTVTGDVTHPWYAVRVRSNREHLVSVHLREHGYEQFAPSYKVERQWSDRVRKIDRFLFPGYVFCRLDPHDRLPVLMLPGVVDLIGFGKLPAPIPDAEIDRVRKMVESGLPVASWPYLTAGDTVLIESGPLAGLEGILLRTKGKYRLVVSVNLLQRSVAAEIDRGWVRPLRQRQSGILV